MKQDRLFIEDITYESIVFCDMYIKKVITNAKRKFYRAKKNIEKYGIVIVQYDDNENELQYYDENLHNIFSTYITVNEIPIPVHNAKLAEALLNLSDVQRDILLRNIVLGDSLTSIALEYGVSTQMISKYKNKALKNIKERMTN